MSTLGERRVPHGPATAGRAPGRWSALRAPWFATGAGPARRNALDVVQGRPSARRPPRGAAARREYADDPSRQSDDAGSMRGLRRAAQARAAPPAGRVGGRPRALLWGFTCGQAAVHSLHTSARSRTVRDGPFGAASSGEAAPLSRALGARTLSECTHVSAGVTGTRERARDEAESRNTRATRVRERARASSLTEPALRAPKPGTQPWPVGTVPSTWRSP